MTQVVDQGLISKSIFLQVDELKISGKQVSIPV